MAHQWPNAAHWFIVVILVLTLHRASVPRVWAGAPTPKVNQGHGGLQLRQRILRRMAAPRRLHLCVQLDVGVVCVVERAGAVLAGGRVAVTFLAAFGVLAGGAREVAEEVEGLAKGFLRSAGKGTRRIHAARCIADGERRDCMLSAARFAKSCAQAATRLCCIASSCTPRLCPLDPFKLREGGLIVIWGPTKPQHHLLMFYFYRYQRIIDRVAWISSRGPCWSVRHNHADGSLAGFISASIQLKMYACRPDMSHPN